jgi:hypothetical protein
MPSTPKVPLGAATLNRKWYVDVNTNTYANPTWVGVFGVSDFKATKEPSLQEDADFDSGGWKSSTLSALAWALELKLERKVKDGAPTIYDPGQEVLRAASDLLGVSNTIDIRWYEVTSSGPKVEAYRGYATVSWVPDGGSMDALDTVTVTLTGQGERSAIAHPDAVAAVPVVYALVPATDVEAGGALVKITGRNFTGATDVDFGASGADFIVLSDHLIVAVAPARAAGAVNVVVTNATGPSTSTATFTYTVA